MCVAIYIARRPLWRKYMFPSGTCTHLVEPWEIKYRLTTLEFGSGGGGWWRGPHCLLFPECWADLASFLNVGFVLDQTSLKASKLCQVVGSWPTLLARRPSTVISWWVLASGEGGALTGPLLSVDRNPHWETNCFSLKSLLRSPAGCL